MKKNINFKNSCFKTSIFLKTQILFSLKKLVIFVGKSNVGKSSIINKITDSKIAKTANNPGKTQSINIYDIDNKFNIIDLPGFGYSNVSKEKQIYWKDLIETFFFINKTNIKLFIYVIDIRHNPSENELIMINYLKKIKIPYIILLNKCDKLNVLNNEIILNFKQKLLLNSDFNNIEVFSIKNNKYLGNILTKIVNSLNFKESDLYK